MVEDRSAVVTIGGEEYELLLTTRATKLIGKRYGGLENLGEKLLKAENFDMALDEIIWLITLLANQPIQIYNLKNKENPRELLAEDDVELLTTPLEIATFRTAITQAMSNGMRRDILSEPDQKNEVTG